MKVDVLMHQRESWRPSSTGCLIKRVIPASGVHLYRRERPLERATVVESGKTFWILHPRGEPLPSVVSPVDLQVLLLDGNWRQAGEMMHAVESWGRAVCLPMSGANRYWLRTELGEGNYCTVEALIFLLAALGLEHAHTQLRLQFELRVYAGLRSRGAKAKAEQYLATSPLREALSEMIDQLIRRRVHDAEA